MEMDVFLWIIPSMPPIPPAKAPLRFYGKGFLSDEVAGDDWGDEISRAYVEVVLMGWRIFTCIKVGGGRWVFGRLS